MPQVIIHVNERPYNMVCDAGEEEHLTELAKILDKEVVRLKKAFGQVGDSRLLLMAAIVIADKLSEATGQIDALKEEVEGLKDARSAAVERGRSLEQAMCERLNAAADRIETLAQELNAATR